jgi:hypothetical protein
MPGVVRVFVSHHHSPEEDASTARLVADLKAAGADVWVDNESITSDDFVRKISEGLAGRQWLVLVMTPESVKSPWVQREVNVALAEQTAGRMLGVIPFVMAPCRDTDIPALWRTLQRYDATRGYEQALDRLLQVLRLPVTPQAAPEVPIIQAVPRPAPQPAVSHSVVRTVLRHYEPGYTDRRFAIYVGLGGGILALAVSGWISAVVSPAGNPVSLVVLTVMTFLVICILAGVLPAWRDGSSLSVLLSAGIAAVLFSVSLSVVIYGQVSAATQTSSPLTPLTILRLLGFFGIPAFLVVSLSGAVARLMYQRARARTP